MSRLHEDYLNRIRPMLAKNLGIQNLLAVPALDKIVINMCAPEDLQDAKKAQAISDQIAAIAGQRPVVTKAKKSIAGFKVRQGMSLGMRVTLRKKKMYEFLDRLVNIALPRVRDFRGLPGYSFDGAGNYSLGIKEQIIFPEINYDKIDKIWGLNVGICTTATDNVQAKELLIALGLPIKEV